MNKGRILIVEDEFLIAHFLMTRLCLFGYECVGPAVSGPAAEKMAESERPDLVLMDIKLKGPMNGIEAARRIWEARRIPSLFLSAFADAYAAEINAFEGSLGCLGKPVEDGLLKERLEAAMPKKPALVKK